MTVPSNIIFPMRSQAVRDGESDAVDSYLKELTFTLQRMYEQVAQGINGDIRTNYSEDSRLWTPTLNGTTPGLFTYTGGGHQIGWIWRQGIFTELWFDVSWTAKDGSVAGNLYLELPYIAAVSDQMPFVGVVQPSSVTYTGGTELVINAIPNTNRGEFWYTGSGVATGNQAVVASGRLIGHIRYIGKQNEA